MFCHGSTLDYKVWRTCFRGWRFVARLSYLEDYLEAGRKYRLEQRSNGAGFFFFFIVFGVESGGEEVRPGLSRGKRGLLGGWKTLANKVRFLGVGCSVISAGGNKSLAPARREEKPLYVEAAKVHFGRARDAVWLQLRETDSLECRKPILW